MENEKIMIQLECDQNEYVGEVPLSYKIDEILCTFAEIQHVYAVSHEKVQRMDRLTQDYLHALELQDNNYHERARIATALQQCRKDRRPDKDNVYLTEQIAAYLGTKKGQELIGRLEHLRNTARNIERTRPGRKYTPRVLTQREYDNVAKKLSSLPSINGESAEMLDEGDQEARRPKADERKRASDEL